MTPELQQQIFSRLDALAAKLGVASQQLWAVLLKQAKVEAITDSIGFLIMLCGVILSWRILLSGLKAKDGDADAEGLGRVIIGVIGTMIGTIAGLVFLFCIPTELFNPQYWALSKILSMLK